MLLALEGIDRAGKGTQSGMLQAAWEREGRRAVCLHFPAYETPIGKEIAAFLRGEREFGPETLQMLYAANRYEKRAELLQMRSQADLVLLDRYATSGRVYGQAMGLEREWLRNLDRGLPQPDLVVLLDLDPGEAARRRREAGEDIIERQRTFMEQVREIYREEARREGWVVVDGAHPPGEVHARIREAVEKWRTSD